MSIPGDRHRRRRWCTSLYLRRSAGSGRTHRIERENAVHVSDWQFSDRLGLDSRFTGGDGKSGSGLTNDNWRDGGGSKLTCGAGGVHWNWNWTGGGDWTGDWTGDRYGDGNWNYNILSSNWEGDNGYSLFGGTSHGLCNDLFHRLSNLNSFRDDNLFRLAATLGIVVVSRHFSRTDLCSNKRRRRLALANRRRDVVRHGPIFRACFARDALRSLRFRRTDLGCPIKGWDARQ